MVYPEGLRGAVGFGSGDDVPQGVMQRADLPRGYARQLDGNGGVRVAWAWRLRLTCLTSLTSLTRGRARLRPDGLRRGKPCDTPWVCLPQFGLARAKICRLG